MSVCLCVGGHHPCLRGHTSGGHCFLVLILSHRRMQRFLNSSKRLHKPVSQCISVQPPKERCPRPTHTLESDKMCVPFKKASHNKGPTLVISQLNFIDTLFGASNPLYTSPEWTALAVPHVLCIGDKVTFFILKLSVLFIQHASQLNWYRCFLK